jgi:hypothetical protein
VLSTALLKTRLEDWQWSLLTVLTEHLSDTFNNQKEDKPSKTVNKVWLLREALLSSCAGKCYLVCLLTSVLCCSGIGKRHIENTAGTENLSRFFGEQGNL